MPFHRLTVPSYFGGLPGGYDYLNTPSDPSVGGSGVPAPMSLKKTGGPNDGTYFVAFGEDARATFANRGMKALGENSDFIDNILRASIPKISFLEDTAVGAVSTVNLVGQIFVGDFGLANNATNRNQLVHVTDQSTNDDLEVSGTKIIATLIHDGASVNVVGLSADGFRTNASVNFSPSIPNGTNYRVWFGIRSSFTEIANTEKGAYFRYIMRIMEHVPGSMRSQLRQLHSEASVNQGYLDPWDSTIRSLASSGLNERYRRSTTQPAGFVTGDYNVAGGGAIITRDGQAVTILSPNFGDQATATAFPDKNLASIKLLSAVDDHSSNPILTTRGGDHGLWHENEWRPQTAFVGGDSRNRSVAAGPGLIEVIPWDVRSATFNGDAVITFINNTADATLNPASGVTANDRRTIQCAAGQFFAVATPQLHTAMRLGIDLIEVTRVDGSVQLYVVDFVASLTTIRVVTLANGLPDFGAVAIPTVRLRWIQVILKTGGVLNQDESAGSYYARPLFVMAPATITQTFNEKPGPCAFFGAASGSLINGKSGGSLTRALEWGAGFNEDGGGQTPGSIFPNGWLSGVGGVHAVYLSLTNALIDELGDSTFNNVTSAGDIVATDDLQAGDDLFVGDDAHITGDADVGTLAIMNPDYHVVVDEDWIRFTQNFIPNVIWTHHNTWQFNEITSAMTLNNGTPSTKNPGQLQVIAAGGGTAKKLSIYPTSQFPFAFANLELMTITVAVTDDPANNYAGLTIGLSDSTTVLGNDNLSLIYVNGLGWALIHMVAGVPGTHHFAVLGAQTNGVFVVVRFVRQANGDIAVFFNGVLALTVTVAQLPTGNCTFVQYYEQTVGDASATTWTVDRSYARFFSSTDRSGA